MALGKKIKELRDAKDLTQQELSDLTGGIASQVAISNLEKRDSESSKFTAVLAEALGVSVDVLTGAVADEMQSRQNTLSANQINRVPLVSWVQAGNWTDVTDYLADEGNTVETTYKARSRTFALIVQGQSMEPKFPAGCTIIVEPDEIPANGHYIIVRQNGDTEATFKQLVVEGDRKYLKALNPDWPKRIIEMLPDAVICGVVKRVEMEV